MRVQQLYPKLTTPKAGASYTVSPALSHSATRTVSAAREALKTSDRAEPASTSHRITAPERLFSHHGFSRQRLPFLHKGSAELTGREGKH